MTPRATRGTAGALLAAVVLHLLTRTTGDPWLALASAAALVLPVASLVQRPPLPELQVERQQPARVVAGAEVDQLLQVRNAGGRTSPPATWRDESPGLEPVEVALPELAPGEQVALPVRRRAGRRGVYDGPGQAVLTTTAPFGVLRWTQHRSVPGPPLLVHPVTGSGRVLLAGAGAPEEGAPSGTPGSGGEVLGLRPWRHGDAARDVSARASARHGRPVVLERERESGPGLLVLVTGGGAGPTWEAGVGSAASLVLAALRAGRAVSLVAGEGGPVAPRRLDSTAVLDFFAAVDRVGPLAAATATAAVRRVPPGGSVLVLQGAWPVPVRAAGCRVEVLGA